jgi:hypothetical protein
LLILQNNKSRCYHASIASTKTASCPGLKTIQNVLIVASTYTIQAMKDKRMKAIITTTNNNNNHEKIEFSHKALSTFQKILYEAIIF